MKLELRHKRTLAFLTALSLGASLGAVALVYSSPSASAETVTATTAVKRRPYNIAATARGTSVTVTWKGYPRRGWAIQRDGRDASGKLDARRSLSSRTQSYTFKNLKPGTRYKFTLTDLNNNRRVDVWATTPKAVVKPAPKPPAPKPTTPTPTTPPVTPKPTTPTPPVSSGWAVGQRSGLPFDLGVFAHDPERVKRFESKVGRKVDVYQVAPQRNEGFGEFLSELRRIGNYIPSDAKMDLALPLYTYEQGKQIGQVLKETGHGDAYVRPGWEFNLGGMGWAWTVDQIGYDNFKSGYRNTMGGIKSVVPGVKSEWNPNAGTKGFAHAVKAYPGDDIVDVIGVDVYNWKYEDSWNADGDLNDWLAFAKQHNKKMTIPEWGVHGGSDGRGDNPAYVTQMLNWVYTNRKDVVMTSYFDENMSYIRNSIADGQMPKSGQAFREALAKM